MVPVISLIVPNRNGAATIGLCLEAAYRSVCESFEVIVVDDGSDDTSVAVIERFPCRLVRLGRHNGASAARNAGAAASRGDILFFTDADCLIEPDALAIATAAVSEYGPGVVVGGTYTPEPYDTDFFSRFQSLFVHYSETKNVGAADYAAGHALAIDAATFRESGGFAEGFLPVAEDVEFSHRLRRGGLRIVIEPRLRVRHIFGFSLRRSLHNAAFKAMHWTVYSMRNGDVFADSGTASTELKANVVFLYAAASLLVASAAGAGAPFLYLAVLPLATSAAVGRSLIRAFFAGGGAAFGIAATLYYLSLFGLAVGAGAIAGTVRHLASARHSSQGG